MPEGIALAPDGKLIVAEVGAKRIIQIDPASGTVTEIAGNLPIGLAAAPGGLPTNIPTGVGVGAIGGDLLLVGRGECDLQGGEEVAEIACDNSTWGRSTRLPPSGPVHDNLVAMVMAKNSRRGTRRLFQHLDHVNGFRAL